MNPQDGLYTVTERAKSGASTRVIGAVSTVIAAADEPERAAAALAAPATHIVSLTVTEKGYCRATDGSLDPELAGPQSIYRFLAEGLRRRFDARLPGVSLVSCDNIADNGQQLDRLVGEYCERHDPALGAWIAAECAFPCSMVDRIVPATMPSDRNNIEAVLGLRDEAAVITEPFSQWVIEDRFAGPRPRWEAAGAQLVADVAPYETAKLRMLNGAHSALAYLGLDRGHTFVHQAVADPAIRSLIERLMRQEAATSFAPAPGQDLGDYADALLARFANPALWHRLAQIAIDGSQKIPQRWLATLAAQQQQGRECPAILSALGAWLRHVRGDNGNVNDPLAAALRTAWDSAGAAGIMSAVFGDGGLIGSHWRPSPTELRDLSALCGI